MEGNSENINEYDSKDFCEQFSRNYTLLTFNKKYSTTTIDHKISYEMNLKKVNELLEQKGKIKIGALFELIENEIKKDPKVRIGEPVISSTFSVWRNEALKVFGKMSVIFPEEIQDKLFVYMIQKIDFEFLPMYVTTAWRNYEDKIDLKGFGIEPDSSVDQELRQKLIKAICKWLISIELINDTLDRLKKYDILNYEETDAYKKCHAKWKPSVHKCLLSYLVNSYTLGMATQLEKVFKINPFTFAKGLMACKVPMAATFSFGVLKSIDRKSVV